MTSGSPRRFWVFTAAGPAAVDQPGFVEKEPFGSPWDDRLGEEAIRLPIVLAWVVEAQRPPCFDIRSTEDVWWLLAGSPWVQPNSWLENLHRDPWVGDERAPEPYSRAVGDADLILRGYRAKRAAPHAKKIKRARLLEIRK
jgi:hypothetical protein